MASVRVPLIRRTGCNPKSRPVPRVIADRRPFEPLVDTPSALEGRERLTRRDWTSALGRAARGPTGADVAARIAPGLVRDSADTADHAATLPACCYDGTIGSKMDGKGDFLS